MLPEAHGSADRRTATHRLDVRDARRRGPTCSPASTSSATRRRSSGSGCAVADLPAYASHNDLGTAVLLAAMHDGRRRRGWCSPRRWSSTARAATRAPTTGRDPGAAVGARPRTPAASRTPARPAADPLDWALVDEDARLDPRSSYAASKVAQEHYASAWARQAGGPAVALRYHNVYGPGMPRDTPYAGVAAMFRSALERGEPPRVFEDGGQMRDFVHVDDVARANVARTDGRTVEREPGTPRRTTSARVSRSRSALSREPSQRTGRSPTVTGEYRLGDVRHIVASPERAAADLGFRAEIGPDEGLARFATDPLRA